MAVLPELWHICVFIEAGGNGVGEVGGGGCVGVCMCASMRFGACAVGAGGSW